MIGAGRTLALLWGCLLSVASAAGAQSRRPALSIEPPGAGSSGALVSATSLFADQSMRDLLRSGFPASLHYRLELWRAGGLFNDLESKVEWEVIVQYDPSAQRYLVARRQGGKLEEVGTFATLSTAQSVIERPARIMLIPERAGSRYYYILVLDIEALSVSDMDQLERWLRGVKGGTAASAVGNGMRTLMLRMLGGENKHLSARSEFFVAEK
ncbi:MAG: hypothetical protein V4550_20620 [Gemmatimonadota bacterium]